MSNDRLALSQWRGFSMVELMVVLSIATILLTIGIPSFRSFIQTQRITTTVNDFFAAINLTRSEAIQRGARVDLVPLGDGSDWTKGWIVFVDENDNQKPDSGEKTIFSHGPVPDGMTIKSNFTDATGKYIAYNGTGRTRINANSQTPQSGTLSFTLEEQNRQIKINFLGRPRVCKPATDALDC